MIIGNKYVGKVEIKREVKRLFRYYKRAVI